MKAETGHSPAADPGEPPKSRGIPRWGVVIAAVVSAIVIIVVAYGYLARPGWVGVAGKTFWDYLELLIVPAALAMGVYLLNRAQERERRAQDAHTEHEREVEAEQREREREATEEARRKRELEVQSQHAQDAALQAYLDQMSQLLLDKRDDQLVRMGVDDDVRQVVQARAEPLLRSLDSTRKWSLVLFLAVVGLLTKDHPLVSLAGADLRGVDGRGAPLQGVDLQGADLSEANLSGANLTETYLTEADLSRIDLNEADLSGAYLSQANLSEAFLAGANLSKALLSGANLFKAHLLVADLSGVNLYLANLSEAYLVMAKGITNEELERQAESLKGATMPNDQKYEDWLKDKEGREDDRRTVALRNCC